MKRAGLLLLALLLQGCPPVRVVATQVVAKDQVAQTLTEAEAAFARRPDVAQVRRAVALFSAAANADETRTEGPVGVVRCVAWLLEHGVKEEKASLIATMLLAAEQCQQRAPASALCDYWQAAALGLEAREEPTRGLSALKRIVELLHRAQASQPGLDEGGPSRAMALLLLRAPGWPVGPGDPDSGLAEAQQALKLGPQHPMNQLAVAEGLLATGDVEGAKAAYARAKVLGEQRAAKGDPEGADFARQAEAALNNL